MVSSIVVAVLAGSRGGSVNGNRSAGHVPIRTGFLFQHAGVSITTTRT